MLSHRAIATAAIVFVAGYACGTMFPATQPLSAQQDGSTAKYSNETLSAYRKTHKSATDLFSVFKAAGQTTSVSGGINYFGVSVGGTDAEKDLNDGQGVDPETFAALYAGLVTPSIAADLDQDEQGRLRYKKNVIRMYSSERLRQLYQRREELEIQSEDSQ